MKLLLVGNDAPVDSFRLCDPDSVSESEFEHFTVGTMTRAYPKYWCFLFGGTFVHAECGAKRPDLALVARDLSHWFVVEVEIGSHSLEHHVLPQVRAFVYGEPQPDCASSIMNGTGIGRQQAETLVRLVPKSVAVITNQRDDLWSKKIEAVPAQILVVSRFQSAGGNVAAGIDGELRVVRESLGFGQYSAVDRSIRFARSAPIPQGVFDFEDDRGATAAWKVVRSIGAIWMTKVTGTPSIVDGSFLQLVRTHDGRLILRSKLP